MKDQKIYMSEDMAREQICEIGKRMYDKSFVAANDGNISIRIGPTTIICTPTGVSKGFMTPGMLVKINLSGEKIDGNLDPSSETKMHLRVYKENDEAMAVVHCHPPVATSFAVAGIPLDRAFLPEAVVTLGEVPCTSYATPGTMGVPESIAPYCTSHHAVLLANHGALTWGRDLTEAWFRMESLEHNAKIVLYSTKLLGRANELSGDEIGRLIEIRQSMGIHSGGNMGCTQPSDRQPSDREMIGRPSQPRPIISRSSGCLGVTAVRLDDENSELIILDQTLLPNEKKYLHLKTQESIWEAIYKLQVRGAPAIGITGAFGAYLGMKPSIAQNYGEFYEEYQKVKDYLASSRPTAVNLCWALERMEKCIQNNKELAVANIKKALLNEANRIREEDEEVCRQIGVHGLTLLKPGMGILTHCNAGTIATAKYGTALAPIYLGHEKGYNFKVFADETRPLLQGARLTSWELNEAGIDVTLICDNMASIVMKNGWIQAVVVGCDRVAANGDAANKIGTSGVAILAKEYGIPFYVHAPLSTIDLATETGEDIHIELRPVEEIYKSWYEKPMAPEGIKAYNPAFDVTDAKYSTAIVTEKGVVYPPYKENLARLFEK